MLAAVALSYPGTLAAQSSTTQSSAARPASYARTSVSGSYLAARHASTERDAAAAAAHYRAALRGDPRNNELLARAFTAVLTNGDVEEAVKLAERVLQVDKTDRVARLVLGVRAIKQKQYAAARAQLTQLRGPINELAATLLIAWSQAAPNDSKAAVETLDRLAGPESYNLFKNMHAGLILDYAGQKREAGKRFERARELDPTQVRLVQAYGSYLSRLTPAKRDEALKVYSAFDEVLPRHPLVREAMADLKAGKRVAPLVDSPQAGAAEALYGLGAALGRRGEELGLVFFQLALYLAPTHPMALLSLADIYEGVKKYELAIQIYDRVPATSPMRRNALIQRAVDLDALDRTDEAKAALQKLMTENPTDLEAITALGNILRGRKQFSECAEVYGKGLDAIDKVEKPNWVLFYFRGICYERSKQWPSAEADMKKALELFPDQPLVLNYLGYSWVDQGINLDEGMRMIQRAVEQRPDDGYIVDSLGWAHYRLGNYDDAVKHLEQAVELKPEDPTINDHLGDAYWKVGRELEARFQWSHARDLKPEPEELAKVEEKLRAGLTGEPASAAEAQQRLKPGGG